MELKKNDNGISLQTFYYHLQISPDQFILINPRAGDLLIDCPTPVFFRPKIAGEEINWEFKNFQTKSSGSGSTEIVISALPDQDIVGELKIALTCFEEHFEFSASCPANKDLVLGQWNFFTEGSKITPYWAHHFRNRHGNTLPYETYNLMRGSADSSTPKFSEETPREMVEQWVGDADFSTFSSDWQFAPHPSFVLFQKDEAMLCLGAKDIPQAFGLEVKIGRNTIKKCCLNYGGKFGYPVKKGEQITAATMYTWLEHYKDVWDSVDHYLDLLLEDNMVPRRSQRNVPHWWLKPVYCTWHDQGFLANHNYSHLHKTDGWTGGKKKNVGSKKLKQMSGGRYKFLTPDMITQVLDTIKRENLNFGSIILDASWFVTQGQWEADKDRFPDLRSDIERIHDAGLKAILWISPMMFDPKSIAAQHPEWLMNNGEILEKYPYPQLDFSNPEVQKEYVKPTLRYIFSDEDGCLNADGVKIDYLAGKVFPEFNIHDISWRGEERFVRNTMKMYYDEMKKYKDDACMIGISIHPSFIDCQDMIRTYDVTGSQTQHEERGKMIRHFCPGNFISFDFVEERHNWEKYFDMAEAYNGLVEHSNILGVEGEALCELDYEYLRNRLGKWR